MPIFLPVAGVSLSIFYLIGIGGSVGLLSGLIGVEGVSPDARSHDDWRPPNRGGGIWLLPDGRNILFGRRGSLSSRKCGRQNGWVVACRGPHRGGLWRACHQAAGGRREKPIWSSR